MNPLLVTGAISLGGKIFNSVFRNADASQAAKAGFEQQLDKAAGTPQESALLAFLKSQGISSFDGLKTLDGQLVEQLKAMPELADKLSAFGPGDVLNLKIEDNLITIESADGHVATIAADSEAGAIARRIHNLRTMQVEHANQPGKSLTEIANQVAAVQTPPSAQWSLNPFAR